MNRHLLLLLVWLGALLVLLPACDPNRSDDDDDDDDSSGDDDDTSDDDDSTPAGDFDMDSLSVGIEEAGIHLLAEAGVQPIEMRTDAPPAYGEAYETQFDTVMRRVNEAALGNHLYSQLQAFSPDDAYVLVVEGDSPETMDAVVKTWPGGDLVLTSPGWGAWQAVRWLPNTDDHHLVHFDGEAVGVQLQVTDVDTGGVLSDWAFPTEYSAVLANQSSDELSRDGRWLAGMGLVDGNDARIFTFDLDAGQLGTELSIAELYDGPCSAGEGYDPDWVGVSPLGNWLVVQWVTGDPGRCNGLETFDIATGEFVGRVTLESPHADLTVLDDGETEVFVTAELLAPGAGEGYVDGTAGGTALEDSYPSFAYRVLPGDPVGTAEPNHLVLTDWIFEHISCRGPYGWCLVTAANSPGNGVWDPLEEELFLLKLDGSGVVRLGHHRSDPTIQPTDDDYYWAQPRASFSASGRYVIFDTNWGVAPDTHAYVIDLGE